MPTATATILSLDTICTCDSCCGEFKRSDMSACNGICNDCLSTRYTMCNICSAPVHYGTGPLDLHSRRFGHVRNDLWTYDSQPACYHCYDSLRNSNRWPTTPLDASIVTYNKIGSTRKFGVEIETSLCGGYEVLKGRTVFGAKHDPTISGLEFDSPVLYGDVGFEHIRELSDFADRNDWEADEDCGCHTHFDMRGETEDQLWATLYAYTLTYPLWSAAVSPERRRNSYCRQPCRSLGDIANAADESESFWYYAAHESERYDYLNVVAYDDHNTFEVRLLDGTLDADTICNWVALHARFIDRVHNMSFADIRAMGITYDQQFSSLVELIDDTPLMDWLAVRMTNVGETYMRRPGLSTQPA